MHNYNQQQYLIYEHQLSIIYNHFNTQLNQQSTFSITRQSESSPIQYRPICAFTQARNGGTHTCTHTAHVMQKENNKIRRNPVAINITNHESNKIGLLHNKILTTQYNINITAV